MRDLAPKRIVRSQKPHRRDIEILQLESRQSRQTSQAGEHPLQLPQTRRRIDSKLGRTNPIPDLHKSKIRVLQHATIMVEDGNRPPMKLAKRCAARTPRLVGRSDPQFLGGCEAGT